MGDYQEDFNNIFCGGCGAKSSYCFSNMVNVKTLTGYDVSQAPIINNPLQIQLINNITG